MRKRVPNDYAVILASSTTGTAVIVFSFFRHATSFYGSGTSERDVPERLVLTLSSIELFVNTLCY